TPSVLSAPRALAPTQTQRPATNGSSSGTSKPSSSGATSPSTSSGTPTEANRDNSASPPSTDETPRTPGRLDATPEDSDPTGAPRLPAPENTRNTSYDRNA